MNPILSCHKCDFETSERLAKCPQCGSRLQSVKKVRILGWLLLVIGTGLVIFMGTLGVVLARIIAGSGDPGATTRFTGGPKEVSLIITVFGLVISFGLASMVVAPRKRSGPGCDLTGRSLVPAIMRGTTVRAS